MKVQAAQQLSQIAGEQDAETSFGEEAKVTADLTDAADELEPESERATVKAGHGVPVEPEAAGGQLMERGTPEIIGLTDEREVVPSQEEPLSVKAEEEQVLAPSVAEETSPEEEAAMELVPAEMAHEQECDASGAAHMNVKAQNQQMAAPSVAETSPEEEATMEVDPEPAYERESGAGGAAQMSETAEIQQMLAPSVAEISPEGKATMEVDPMLAEEAPELDAPSWYQAMEEVEQWVAAEPDSETPFGEEMMVVAEQMVVDEPEPSASQEAKGKEKATKGDLAMEDARHSEMTAEEAVIEEQRQIIAYFEAERAALVDQGLLQEVDGDLIIPDAESSRQAEERRIREEADARLVETLGRLLDGMQVDVEKTGTWAGQQSISAAAPIEDARMAELDLDGDADMDSLFDGEYEYEWTESDDEDGAAMADVSRAPETNLAHGQHEDARMEPVIEDTEAMAEVSRVPEANLGFMEALRSHEQALRAEEAARQRQEQQRAHHQAVALRAIQARQEAEARQAGRDAVMQHAAEQLRLLRTNVVTALRGEQARYAACQTQAQVPEPTHTPAAMTEANGAPTSSAAVDQTRRITDSLASTQPQPFSFKGSPDSPPTTVSQPVSMPFAFASAGDHSATPFTFTPVAPQAAAPAVAAAVPASPAERKVLVPRRAKGISAEARRKAAQEAEEIQEAQRRAAEEFNQAEWNEYLTATEEGRREAEWVAEQEALLEAEFAAATVSEGQEGEPEAQAPPEPEPVMQPEQSPTPEQPTASPMTREEARAAKAEAKRKLLQEFAAIEEARKASEEAFQEQVAASSSQEEVTPETHPDLFESVPLSEAVVEFAEGAAAARATALSAEASRLAREAAEALWAQVEDNIVRREADVEEEVDEDETELDEEEPAAEDTDEEEWGWAQHDGHRE